MPYGRNLRYLGVGEPLWGDQSNGTQDPSPSGEKVKKEGGGQQGHQSKTAK